MVTSLKPVTPHKESLADVMQNFCDKFPPVEYEQRPVCIPGIGDVFLRRVTVLGHNGEYPRPYNWENLLNQLREDEELLWIIRKHGNELGKKITGMVGGGSGFGFEIYLGLKYTGDVPATKEEWQWRAKRFSILTRQFAKNAFPESVMMKDLDETGTIDFLADIVSMKQLRVVVGMPSLKDVDLKTVLAKRDEHARPYAGLNDIIEMHGAAENEFALIFSVSKASEYDIRNMFDALFFLQSKVKPSIEEVMQHTDGSTDSIAGGSKSERETAPLTTRIKEFCHSAKVFFRGTEGGEKRANLDRKKEIGVQETHTDTKTIKKFHADLSFADEQIVAFLEQLKQTLGTGGYFCGAVAYSNDGFLAQSVAESARAVMSGGQSSLFPMRVHEFVDGRSNDWLIQKKTLARALSESNIPCGIVNNEKACLYLPVPTTHLAGMQLKKNVFYGKDNSEVHSANVVPVGSMAFAEAHVKFETISSDSNHVELEIPESDFYSHFFVVGTTGSGKTKRAANILHNAQGFRRIILETAKKTYWQELGLDPDELLIYTLGDSTHKPLRFNPFYFEPGTSLKQHISILADAICDLLPMEALIGPKLREAVEMCYRACGWDIETSQREKTNCALEYPDVAMFRLMVRRVAEKMSDYSSEVQGNYKGALLNRAAIFMDDLYQDIFAFGGNQSIDTLFPPDKVVIIEMEEMPPSEINMPAFIISLLLQRIRAYQDLLVKAGKEAENKGFLIAIEEAHNVLSRNIQEKNDDMQSGKGGHLVKQVSRLLAEGRALKIGLMIIDQSAAQIAPAVITNTKSKLIFRQEDGTEIETIGKAIGLRQDEWSDLQLLGDGECLLRNKRFIRPIKIAPLAETKLVRKTKCSRSEFVPRAKVIPSYAKGVNLLRIYCLTDGACRDKNGKLVIYGYHAPAFALIDKKLCQMCGNRKDLAEYIKRKTLIELGAYRTAEMEIGI